jgi:hypothetical protein
MLLCAVERQSVKKRVCEREEDYRLKRNADATWRGKRERERKRDRERVRERENECVEESVWEGGIRSVDGVGGHARRLHCQLREFPLRGGLVCKAHGLLYHSTLGSRATKKKKISPARERERERKRARESERGGGRERQREREKDLEGALRPVAYHLDLVALLLLCRGFGCRVEGVVLRV